ncbi:MAG TPA: hypothetical protein PKG71_03590 [Candidatus Woesebacteria bacterium]|nr:hypothetical protein [Candidatus Woesebacteria bacterium]HNS95025.1 hypothetical protein [Candidatus Woesebacteria bacterium]
MQTESQFSTSAIVGYMLLVMGVVIMILSVVQVYRVISRQAEPIAFFTFQGISINPSQYAPQVDMSALDALRSQLNLGKSAPTQPALGESVEIIPAEVINGPANLGVFFLFMGFLLNVGYKFADLGVKLVRPVYVKMNAQSAS